MPLERDLPTQHTTDVLMQKILNLEGMHVTVRVPTVGNVSKMQAEVHGDLAGAIRQALGEFRDDYGIEGFEEWIQTKMLLLRAFDSSRQACDNTLSLIQRYDTSNAIGNQIWQWIPFTRKTIDTRYRDFAETKARRRIYDEICKVLDNMLA